MTIRILCALLFSAVSPALCRADFLTPAPNLGQAGPYTVLGLNLTVDSTGGTSHVIGDVGVGPNGTLNLQGGSIVVGTVYKDPTGTVVTGGGSTISGGIVTRSLSQAVSDAQAAAAEFASAPANQTITGNLSSGMSFSPNPGGTKIIDITGNVNLGGSSILSFSGTSNDYYVVNVGGSFAFGGTSAILLSGGLTPQNLFFNIELNNNNAVGLMLASGTHSFGTFLVPYSEVMLDGGTQPNPVLIGAVIGGGASINIQSTAWVVGVPEPGSVTLLVLGGAAFGAVAAWRRRWDRTDL